MLDLHTFRPRDIPVLVRDYLDECRARRIYQVRIIHGKGVGAQRRAVHRVLETHEAVKAFRTADESAGGWGATLVDLHPL